MCMIFYKVPRPRAVGKLILSVLASTIAILVAIVAIKHAIWHGNISS